MAEEPIKKFLVRNVFIDKQAYDAFRQFRAKNEDYPWRSKPFATAAYIMRLNWAQYRQKDLSQVRWPLGIEKPNATSPQVSSSAANDSFWLKDAARPSVDELVEEISSYDIISFDIFDTAVFRKIDQPDDVFRLMSSEMGFEDFRRVRKAAEGKARARKNILEGNREIVLSDIYDILERDYGIDRQWEQREIELELDLSIPNPYIQTIYKKINAMGKKIIFMSDMYLPKPVIIQILSKNGYSEYDELFLSNCLGINKGSGAMQQYILDLFVGKSIIHIGDNIASDYRKTIEVGMDAIHNIDQRRLRRAYDTSDGNIAGSVYRAVINNTMNCGVWEDDLHFDYGFRVGGILAAGYCEFINKTAQEHNCDKILFCARDCDIIHRIYNKYYFQYENEYINISRYAIMGVTAERYYYDYIGRSVLKHAHNSRGSKNIGTILDEIWF